MKPHRLLTASLFLSLVFLAAPLMGATAPEHPGSLPVFLGLESVRKELGITKSQGARLDKIRAEFKSGARLITATSPATAAERSEANAKVKTLVARYNDKAVAVLTPAQRTRLAQIERQTLGGLMLFLPGEQKLLNLTSRQIAAIGKIRTRGEAFANRMAAMFERGAITLQERLAALRNYRIEQSAKCMKVLDPAQRKTFESLQGPKPAKP